MNRWPVHVARIILALFFGILLSRFFMPNASILQMAGFGVCLAGLAYFMEFLRGTRKKTSDE